MIVCICNNISDTTFKQLICDNNITSIKEIKKCDVEFQCCKCAPEVKQIIKDENEKD